MIETTKIIEPQKSVDKSIYYCDICGIDLDDQYSNGNNYNKAELCYAEGCVYGIEDLRDFFRIDICMECMKNKVMPLIEKTFGIKAREHDNY